MRLYGETRPEEVGVLADAALAGGAEVEEGAHTFTVAAIDDDGMQVPAMVAQLLSLPCATVVVDLQIEGGTATAKREIEGGHDGSACGRTAYRFSGLGRGNKFLLALRKQ